MGQVWTSFLRTLIIGACTTWAFNAHAFETWDGCKDCHGGFRSSPYFSLTDGQSWDASLHDGHSLLMLSRDCDACHGSSWTPVILNSSLRGAASDPLSCVGCHGRAEDRIDPAIPIGDGAGLRQHHWNAGETSCFPCHEDSDPERYTPVGEQVLPPYYLTPDPDHPDKPTDSCNLAGTEDYLATFLGLDNDGDLDYDDVDADCSARTAEVDCFDGIDNDSDGLTDCLDSDCEGTVGDGCSTSLPGICAVGSATCRGGAEVCEPHMQPQQEGPAPDASCSDGLDNDCDGLSDGEDPGCQVQHETACFDTLDNDGDGSADCADADCDGVMGGPCDTGQFGVCAAGTGACLGGEEVCLQNELAVPEEVGAGNCGDGLDNDCDRSVDSADSGCVQAEADVFLARFRAPKSVRIGGNRTVSKRIAAVASGNVKAQQATVALMVNRVDALTVGINPASVTTLVGGTDGDARVTFTADIACDQSGSFLLEWTAGISAPENPDTSNDTLTATTAVTCR